MNFIKPFKLDYLITQEYGPSDLIINGVYVYADRFHHGIDFGCPAGTPIFACQSGTVIKSEYIDDYGCYIIIDHGDGYQSMYLHLTSRRVSVGEEVIIGQVIGISGNTGKWTTGPHLHFQINKNGVSVDPTNLFLSYEEIMNIFDVPILLTQEIVDFVYWAILRRAPEKNCPYVGATMSLRQLVGEAGDSKEHTDLYNDAMKWRGNTHDSTGDMFEPIDYTLYRKK